MCNQVVCVCGKNFKKRVDGRTPCCGLRIVMGNEVSNAERFMILEVENQAGVIIPPLMGKPTHVSLWFFDPSQTGPYRYGWPRWPNDVTPAHVEAIEILQELNNARRK